MEPIFFALPGNEEITQRLTKLLNATRGKVLIRHFPDGETYVQLQSDVKGKRAVLVCTLDRPDEKIVPLYFLSQTAKELGAEQICLIAPYLAYMRQDLRFHTGEGITSNYFGFLLTQFIDGLITVDPHLHRKSSLSEVYGVRCKVVHAAGHIAAWIKQHIVKPVLVGPDRESVQWVSVVADQARAPFVVLDKVRHGDKEVEVYFPDMANYREHTPVLVDDIISTARTMIAAIGSLKEMGMKAPVCVGVHGIFAGNAYQDIMQAGAADVITTNTISHQSNRIDISDLLEGAFRDLI